jgi:hypothetical protein
MRTLYGLVTALFIFSCGRPVDSQPETADSISTETGVNISTATDSVAWAQPASQLEQIVVFNPDDSTSQPVFLKWKDVSYSEYGPLYVFEDRKGEELRIRLIEIPNWDFDHNDYLDVTSPANSEFPEVTLKESAVGKWYKAVVQMETRLLDGVEQETPVMRSLEIVYSFD